MTADVRGGAFLTADRAIAAAEAMRAAVETGIIAALDDRPATAAQVAGRCGLDARMVALVLQALGSFSAVVVDGSGRFASRMTVDWLELSSRVWSGLPAALRDGRAVLDLTDSDVASAGYRRHAEHISRITEPLRDQVVDALTGSGPRVLDAGAGAAPWSRALAASDDAIEVTAVDLPAVIEETRRLVARDGLTSRFDFVGADLFELELDGRYDLVLVAGVCRLFGNESNAKLLERLVAHLRRGGTLAVLDALPDIDRADGMSNALYALNLALRTSAGGVHSFASYADWMYGVGLTGTELTLLSMPELSLVRARRPD